MTAFVALVRRPDASIARCELTHVERRVIDFPKLEAQHLAYQQALRGMGLQVEQLPPLPGSPDGVFVEDAALVLDQLAIITRPGVSSRAHEADSARESLRPFRRNLRALSRGTLDGGDVLVAGKKLFVGLSTRTTSPAIEELAELTLPFGYQVIPVGVGGCLHLKTAVTYLGQNTLLANPGWADLSSFAGFRVIEVDPAEPFGANTLLANGKLLYSAEHPRTAARLSQEGFSFELNSISELLKAEAGLTCLSLIFSREN